MAALFVLAAAGTAAALAYFLSEWVLAILSARGAAARLEAFRGGGREDLSPNERAFQIRLALPFAPAGREEEALLLLRLALGGAVGLLVLALGFPPGIALAAGALGGMAAGEMVASRWEAYVREVEAGLPVFLERLASVIQITPHITIAVEELVEAMESGPLRAWLERFLARVRQEGESGWAAMEAEAAALSPALGLAVFLMRRAHETGGPGYGRALAAAAGRLSGILAAREAARAKADGMMGAVRTMLLALGGVLVLFLANPMMQASVKHPAVQIGYAIAMGLAGYGYFFIRDMVREAI